MNSRQRRTNRRKGGSETLGDRPVQTDGRYEATEIPEPKDLFIDHEYRGYPWREDFWAGVMLGGLFTIVVIVAWWMILMGPMVRELEIQQAYDAASLDEAADAVRDAIAMCE